MTSYIGTCIASLMYPTLFIIFIENWYYVEYSFVGIMDEIDLLIQQKLMMPFIDFHY